MIDRQETPDVGASRNRCAMCHTTVKLLSRGLLAEGYRGSCALHTGRRWPRGFLRRNDCVRRNKARAALDVKEPGRRANHGPYHPTTDKRGERDGAHYIPKEGKIMKHLWRPCIRSQQRRESSAAMQHVGEERRRPQGRPRSRQEKEVWRGSDK